MSDDDWANDVISHVLDLSDECGVRRDGSRGAGSGCVHLSLATLRATWDTWSAAELQSLVQIMAGRRLVARVAGADGEELRVHSDARRLHEAHLQRCAALEEEEELNFVEEEILADEMTQGIHPPVTLPHYLARGGSGSAAGAACGGDDDATSSITLSRPEQQQQPPPSKPPPPPPSLAGLVIPNKVTVSSLAKVFSGDDIRVSSNPGTPVAGRPATSPSCEGGKFPMRAPQ